MNKDATTKEALVVAMKKGQVRNFWRIPESRKEGRKEGRENKGRWGRSKGG